MEYKIVGGGSTTDLEFQVNELLKSGWEPHGSMISVAPPKDYYIEYYQPMIRKPPKVIKNHATPKFSTTSKAF